MKTTIDQENSIEGVGSRGGGDDVCPFAEIPVRVNHHALSSRKCCAITYLRMYPFTKICVFLKCLVVIENTASDHGSRIPKREH